MCCGHSSFFVFQWIFFILAGNKNNYNISDEFEFRPDPTSDCGVSYPLVFEKSIFCIAIALTAKLISAFVFATRIVHFLYFLNLKFQASNHLLCLYSSVCVGPVRKPHCCFSHEMAHILTIRSISVRVR